MKPDSPAWMTPDWPAPANVRALMTTRAGGVSTGEYGSFNLGKSSGDLIDNVLANRAVLREKVGREIRYLHQVHGTRAVQAEAVADGEQADAAFTRASNIACAAMAADCMPALFCARDGSVVASAHAGWRGMSAGVLESAVAATQTPAAHLLCWLGPCIGPAHFEVGAEVRAAFVAHDPTAVNAFVPHRSVPDKFFCDLISLAKQRLRALGLTAIYGGHWCTMSAPDYFFSYRRVAQSGRMAALIWKTQ